MTTATGMRISPVKRELDRYVESNGIGDAEPIFDLSPRRVQMLVGDAATAARLDDVSTADVRRYYARSQLRRGVAPAVVMATGGWTRIDGLAEDPATLDRSAIAAAFERADDAPRSDGLFERLDHPALVLDANGHVERVNDRFETATGYDSTALTGRELRGLLTPDDADSFTQAWETALDGETWRGPVSSSLPDGGTLAATLSLAPLGDGHDGFVATLTDETAAERVESPRSTPDRFDEAQQRTLAAGSVLADAGTRQGVFTRVCERLVAGDRYAGAVAFDTPVTESTAPAATAGDTHTDGAALAVAAIDAGELTADGRTLAIPLTTGETDHGCLVVTATDTVGSTERRTLRGLGGRIAETLAAIEWKRLLLADAVVELELRGDNVDSLFGSLSAQLGCELTVEGLVPLNDGSLLYYVTASGVSAERALEQFDEVASSTRLIAAASDGSLLELTATGGSLPSELIDRGASLTGLTATDGVVTLSCELAPTADVREFIDGMKAAYPGVGLLAKREIERSVRTATEFQQALESELTDRQQSVLQVAYHAGYFDWPRGSTAEELADSIGVSSPTLHNHLRRAQRKLLAAFFDGEGDSELA
ncbi:MAG: bacterio-opsin activator domain-containing protein [Halobacteriales archaeon]|nr:bacterio-opsin activator domain-containing protein [Halobacteriales archaeon]